MVTRLRLLVHGCLLAFGLVALLGVAAVPRAFAQLDQEPTDEPLPDVQEPDAAEADPTETGDADADGDTDADADGVPDDDGVEVPEDPTTSADALARDAQDYEPDQRGEHDAPDEEPEEASPPPTAPDSEGDEMRTESVSLTGGAAQGVYTASSFFGFDVQLWLGGGLTSLEALENQNLVRADQQGGFGASLGLSAGLRMGPITVGPRATLTIDPSFMLVTVGADVRAVLSTDALAPTLRASLSGVFLTGLSDALPSQSGAGGVHVELGAGLRWHFLGGFTFGAELSGGYLHLDRQAEASCTEPCADGEFDLRRSGSSDGLTLRFHFSVGYRF